MLRNRKYKTGTRWGIWLWTDVDSEYIRRLHVLKTPWFAICLHWILKPDAEPYVHDHPVTFLSLILRGGYCEERQQVWSGYAQRDEVRTTHRTHRWFNFIRASKGDRHRITHVFPKTLTVCFMGPKTREWGFWIDGKWVYWKDYYTKQREGVQL